MTSRPSDQARKIMDRQLGQLVRLVDDLLDVGRITRGKLRTAPRANRARRRDQERGRCDISRSSRLPVISSTSY